jgi:CheY-like chemotaxis protein
VLVTDDSEVNLIVAKRILEIHGATVAVARNGQEAFDRVAAGPGDFDLVLMDLQMPVLDGCAATKRIRAELPVGNLPILALTADARTTERERTEQAGMNDFISKPFEVDAVIQTICRHVVVHPAALVPAAPPAVSASPGESAWPEIAGIDADDVRPRLDDDLDLFWTILDAFFEERTQTSPWPAAGDLASLLIHASAMHKLKGAAASLGAKHLRDLASESEVACRAGSADGVAALARRISTELRRIERSGQAWRATSRAA